MKRHHILLLMVAAAALATTAQAVMVEMPLAQVADRAALIVQGSVIGQTSRWTDDGRTIMTDVTLRVSDVLKGRAEQDGLLTFQVEGGEVGDMGIWVEHQPRFVSDQEVLLFLRPAQGSGLAVQNAEQGRYCIYQSRAFDYRGRVQDLSRLKADIRLMVDDGGR
jgi:hypothetical protein